MDIHEVIRAARTGQTPPVAVLVGDERFLIERAVSSLKSAALGDGPEGFNDDLFHGKGASGKGIASAARTLPMMAESRFVLVRGADQMAAAELEALAEYLEDPSPSTCMVLVASKFDGRSKFAKLAKKKKVWVDAKPLKSAAVRSFATAESKERGHRLTHDAADALVDALGDDLAAVDDALERLSLYVGSGQEITLDAVESCVTRIRTESIWKLVDSVSDRDAAAALSATGSLLADREPPLRILAMVARQLRMVAKMRQALADGLRGPEAAKQAGAPPFKARDLTEAARKFRSADLRHAFSVLHRTDMALKGSKRPPNLVLEEAILALCQKS